MKIHTKIQQPKLIMHIYTTHQKMVCFDFICELIYNIPMNFHYIKACGRTSSVGRTNGGSCHDVLERQNRTRWCGNPVHFCGLLADRFARHFRRRIYQDGSSHLCQRHGRRAWSRHGLWEIAHTCILRCGAHLPVPRDRRRHRTVVRPNAAGMFQPRTDLAYAAGLLAHFQRRARLGQANHQPAKWLKPPNRITLKQGWTVGGELLKSHRP